MKTKDDKITSISTTTTEAIEITDKNDFYSGLIQEIDIIFDDTVYIPKSERLLAIYDMLTNKSFPRKGRGKSTKPKILDAIVMAATDLKLKLQGAYDD